jgi:AraC-like DNA-binding protein
VKKKKKFILSHLYEKLTLENLAAQVGLSEWQCYRSFKEAAGISIADYIRRARLSEAARKLKEEKRKFWMLPLKRAMTVQMDFSGPSLQSLDVILRSMKNQIFQYSAMFLMTLSTATRIYTKQKVADWIRFRLITVMLLILERRQSIMAASVIYIRTCFLKNFIRLESELQEVAGLI